MASTMLTQAQLNRALLARQMLLRRVRLSVPVTAERMGGIQTQYAPSAYVALWSRVAGMTREALTRALTRRSVVQGTLMRGTIHIVSARDYWPVAAALREPRRRWWLRVTPNAGARRRIVDLAEQTRALLEDGPRRRADLLAALDVDSQTWSGVGFWVDLVRVPPSGTWERRRADLYWLADRWIPPAAATPAAGIDLLVGRYLAGFGPASTADIAGFTGLSMPELEPAFGRIPLRRFVAEDGTPLVDLPRAPIPDGGVPAPVRFLPTWDATLLVHARRTQILPERFRPLLFHSRNPQSLPVFLVDGQVAGAWRHNGERITIDPFEPLPRPARRLVEEEAELLAAYHR